MALSPKPVVSRRPFVSAPYVVDDDGVLRPLAPRRCPRADHGDVPCCLAFERRRKRVFGPGHRLFVMRCHPHGGTFTVYPPGWIPYGRKSVVAVDHRGHLVAAEPGLHPFDDTAFEAVVAAGRGDLWPDTIVLGPSAAGDERADDAMGCRKTQRRHVAGAMRLLALDATATNRQREKVAREIGVDLTELVRAARRIRDGPSLRVRGEEGARVLEQLPMIHLSLAGLLALGHSRGYWGPTLS